MKSLAYTSRSWMAIFLVLAVGGAITACVPSSWGADALLRPGRRPVTTNPPAPFEVTEFVGHGVTLSGWRLRTSREKRGTLIYLHGVADNRNSGLGVAKRFAARGFDVVAYDSRAHGDSGGDACTYGFYEKQDLIRVLDTVDVMPVVLLGSSLGAAVAIQAAAEDERVATVVAVEVFSDLRSVIQERAPFFFTRLDIDRALRTAEHRAAFRVSEVSPVDAAARIHIPVLLIHGALDRDTSPDHSRRVFAALRGHKRLVLLPDAAHNQSLNDKVWDQIEQWVDDVVSEGSVTSDQ